MGAQASVPEDQRRTLVAVGVTGAGKSTTCNLITGSRVFDEEEGFSSGTSEAVLCDALRDGMAVRVIDTVGFLCNQGTAEETEGKFRQFADMTSFGVDVFLLVEKFGRFTESNERHFEMFKEFAGAEALKHTILVFTHVQNKQVQEMLEGGECPKALMNVVGQVAGVVGVESKFRPRQAVGDLHRAVADLVASNDGGRYSNVTLQKARDRRETLQLRIDALRDAHRKSLLGDLRRKLSAGAARYEDVLKAIEGAEAEEKQWGVARSSVRLPGTSQAGGEHSCGGCFEMLPAKASELTRSAKPAKP